MPVVGEGLALVPACRCVWPSQVMLEDIQACAALGADGVVAGCLAADGAVDAAATRQLLHAATGAGAGRGAGRGATGGQAADNRDCR
jgi:hypothetical protein